MATAVTPAQSAASGKAADLPVPADIGTRPERTGDVLCPHCDCVGHKRTSRAITKQHRQIYYQCSNVACSHTWLATLSYEYGIVPSGMPNPKVTLPLRPMPRQHVMELLREHDPEQPDMFASPSCLTPPDTG